MLWHAHGSITKPHRMADFSKIRASNVFASPLFAYHWTDNPELNSALSEGIRAEQARTASVDKSNSGGWHSEVGHLEFLGEPGQRLTRHMIEFGNEATRRVFAEQRVPLQPLRWTLFAWVNVNYRGDFNKMHVHPGSTWSGTYYVEVGDAADESEGATPIQLFDPCQGRATTFFPQLLPTGVVIHPQPGLMVLFPSYVPHMVYPHRGSQPRISIAFNLRKEPFP